MSTSHPAMDSHDDFNGDNAVHHSTAMAIGKNAMGGIVVLCAVVLYFVFLNIYARCVWNRRSSFRRRHLAFVGDQNSPRLHRVGLGKSAIEAIPTFVYQLENNKAAPECAVCLCEFEEEEKGRLLPKCHHSFHIDCIDMWLHSHSTCPLCRASAQPDTPSDSVVILVGDKETASGSRSETEKKAPLLTISEGIASTSMEPDLDINPCHSCRHDKVLPPPTHPTKMLPGATQKRVPSVSSSPFFDKGTASTSRATLDKFIIDLPRRMDGFSSPRLYPSDDHQMFSPSGPSLISPGIRLRSLKRLLSKGKMVVPQSPQDGRNIHLEQEDSSQSLHT